MKKIITSTMLGVISVIFSSMFIHPGQAAIKQNSPCSVINSKYTSKQQLYVCTKNKNKLVWKKSKLIFDNVVIPTIVETTTVSIKTETDSAGIKVKSFSQQASENFLLWAGKNRSVKSNHFVYKNYDIPEDIFLSINKTEMEAKDIFAGFVKQDTYSFYGGEDKDWFYTHKKFIPPGNTSNICGIHPDSLAACVNLIDSTFFRLPHDNFKPSNAASVLGAHEYFHFAQMSLADLTPFIKRSIPRWLEEGSAEFVGYSILSNIESKPYDSLFAQDRKIFIDIDSDPYISGRIFVEFIVSEYGFESILKMFYEYRNNKNFDEIFYSVTNNTVQDTLNNFKKVKNG